MKLSTRLRHPNPSVRREARRLIAATFGDLDEDLNRTAARLDIAPRTVKRWCHEPVPPGWTDSTAGELSATAESAKPTVGLPSSAERVLPPAVPPLPAASEEPAEARAQPVVPSTPFDDFLPRHRRPLALPDETPSPRESRPDPPERSGGGLDPQGPAPFSPPSIEEVPPPALEAVTGPGRITPHAATPPEGTAVPRARPRPEQARRRFAVVLHAHLPWVLGHGTWPHGEDWLLEAVVHCYVPLVAMLRRLAEKGHRHLLTFSVTPVLAAQLADERTPSLVDDYLVHRIQAAHDLETSHPLGSWWRQEFTRLRESWETMGKDLIGALRELAAGDIIELSTSAATHAYLPLMHQRKLLQLEVDAGSAYHHKLFGQRPRGIWMPECAYRPAGAWEHPVTAASEVFRPGNETFLGAAGLEWTVVDAHLVLGGEPFLGYGFPWVDGEGSEGRDPSADELDDLPVARQIQPTFIGTSNVAAFVREPYTARQVWARQIGYPGDPRFLDFHKRHVDTGLRLWRVTDAAVDLADKLPYWPDDASSAIGTQARHFLDLVERIPGLDDGLAVCPYDAELFGHWWYEGPLWLEAVMEAASHRPSLETTTPARELDRHPPRRRTALLEGSWGEEGDHRVWVNPANDWIWHDLQEAENRVAAALASTLSPDRKKALLRELMLMAASDWPFLITMGTATDYATERFEGHRDRLRELLELPPRAPLPSWAGEDLPELEIDLRWWEEEAP